VEIILINRYKMIMWAENQRALRNIMRQVLIYHFLFNWYVQGAAVWTPTFLKVNDKGVVGVGRHGRRFRYRGVL